MKLNLGRICIFCLLIVLSVAFGLGFDAIATAVEKSNYPMDDSIASDMHNVAEEFGIPEHILWGFIKAQSDFSSNKVGNDGSIGLTQLTPDEFLKISEDILQEPTQESALLYAPVPNLRCGTAYLSFLFHKYGIWEVAIAAYEVGTETVDAWLLDEALIGEDGNLTSIPDTQAAKLAKDTLQAADHYKRLYFAS